MIKAAIMGYGTVGSGVYEVITTNQKSIDKKVGQELRVQYVLDLREFPGDPVMDVLTHDFEDIINDDEVKIVAEVMGGLHPAYEFTRRCMEAGKSVCTSNKELVAEHGAELIRIAKEHQVNYLFEASVGGGIPIIRPLNSSLTADVILEISGILNGTTNYMLTKMSREGLNYDDVLKQAQEKGYAELHPEADVEGWDACRKIAILTSLASGNQVDFQDIYTEGITKLTTEDFVYAKKMRCAIKLLAVSRKVGDTYCAMVSPALIRKEHPLYMVNDVFNAVCVEGNMLGASMFYGSGAGKLPTASAVAGDMVDAARHLGKVITTFWNPEKLTLAPVSDMTHRFFVRMRSDAKDVKIFGDVEIVDADIPGEIGFLTPVMTEAEYAAKAKDLEIISMIRMEG
ncbi:MAG: homoserine dehydrogenase [Eubacteriales bacterium]|nr:homoserine dehydrogenase [Eubacteriales bacterium]